MAQHKGRHPSRFFMYFNIPAAGQFTAPAIMAGTDQINTEFWTAISPGSHYFSEGLNRTSAMEKVAEHHQTICPGSNERLIQAIKGLHTWTLGQWNSG